MEITNIKIFKANNRGGKLAYANVVFNDVFIIKRIILFEKKGKKYIAMPSTKRRIEQKNVFRDICHPLNNDLRNEMTEAIFEAYDEFIQENEE